MFIDTRQYRDRSSIGAKCSTARKAIQEYAAPLELLTVL
jgi:hypothetical protein